MVDASGASDLSAKAIINGALSQFGLGTLSEWAWAEYQKTGDVNTVLLNLRSQPDYIHRFPAMGDLAAQGNAISEAAYVNYEQSVRQLLQSYGVVRGMYDTSADIANLLTKNVSPSEVNDRLRLATEAAMTAPQEVRDALAARYGVSGGGLISYYLDPDKAEPLLQQQFASAQVQGAAQRQGMATDLATADRLASEGVSYDQAYQAFGQVAALNPLTGGLGETVGQGTLQDAAFGDANAQAKVTHVQQSRKAAFQSGGGANDSASGVSGLGASSS
jgi:hypothetical protein